MILQSTKAWKKPGLTSRKHHFHRLLVLGLVSLCICTFFLNIGVAEKLNVSPANTESIQTNTYVIEADVFEWRYKVEDGHLYRRLYNLVQNEWVGDWELVY